MINLDKPEHDYRWGGTTYALGTIGAAGYVLENEELIVDVCIRVPEGMPPEALIEVAEKDSEASGVIIQSQVGLDSRECRALSEALLAAATRLDEEAEEPLG